MTALASHNLRLFLNSRKKREFLRFGVTKSHVIPISEFRLEIQNSSPQMLQNKSKAGIMTSCGDEL